MSYPPTSPASELTSFNHKLDRMVALLEAPSKEIQSICVDTTSLKAEVEFLKLQYGSRSISAAAKREKLSTALSVSIIIYIYRTGIIIITMVIILCRICIVCGKAPTGKGKCRYEVRWQSGVCCSYTSSYTNVRCHFSVLGYSCEHNEMVHEGIPRAALE